MKTFILKLISCIVLASFCAHLCETFIVSGDASPKSPSSPAAKHSTDRLETSRGESADHSKTTSLDKAQETIKANRAPDGSASLASEHEDACCQLSHEFSIPADSKWLAELQPAPTNLPTPAEANFAMLNENSPPSPYAPDIFHPPAQS